MMRWSCQRLQGWVPVDPSWSPCSRASAWSCARRSAIFAAASPKSAHFPVRASASDAISSPTRCSSSSEPFAAALSSSKRLTSESVSGSSRANSSSTATVKSVPVSNASRADASCSSAESRCSSPMEGAGYRCPVRPPSLAVILREWGRIGCTGFGGPPAHIALLRRLCVERNDWLSAAEFEDAIAACNLLPGPASTQLAIFCAWRLRGRAGALAGGTAFIVPGLIVILALAVLFLGTSPPLWVLGAGAGAGAAVPAVAIHAGAGLTGASWQRRRQTVRWLCYLAAGAASAATLGPWLVLVLLGCGLIELTVQLTARRRGSTKLPGLPLAPMLAAGAIGGGVLLSVAWVAFKVGALSYGGGFVIIPLMQADAVSHYHWMTGAQFLNAVALGQITPGPVVQTVAV